jgi:hypothetical protein
VHPELNVKLQLEVQVLYYNLNIKSALALPKTYLQDQRLELATRHDTWRKSVARFVEAGR